MPNKILGKSQEDLCLSLLNLKFIKKEDIFKVLEKYYKVPGVDLEILPTDAAGT